MGKGESGMIESMMESDRDEKSGIDGWVKGEVKEEL